MSARYVAWAWEQHPGSINAKLMLLKLADQANDDGVCWPSRRSLAADLGVAVRTVSRMAERLEERGMLTRVVRNRPNGSRTSNYFQLPPLSGETRGSMHGRQGDLVTPDNTRSSSKNSNLSSESQSALWDALTDLFGSADTETSRSKRGKVVRSLVGADADPAEIAKMPVRWQKLFPDATFTETALEKYYGMLLNGNGKQAVPPCEECGIGGGQHLAECSKVTASAK